MSADEPQDKETNPLLAEKPKEVLTRHQIIKCIQDIEDMHPLRDTVCMEDILPPWGWVFPRNDRKAKFRHGLRQAFLMELDLKMPKSETEIQKDPFLILGYGINSYFDLLILLCKMFLSISVFSLPILAIYSSGPAFPDSFVTSLSMGNLGGASMLCKTAFMGMDEMALQCPAGTVMDTEQAQYGIIPKEIENKHFCLHDDLNRALEEEGVANCT